ncbi:MAG TPA: glutathione S-transferase [Burkholderiales bacterium]|jgi:glutathione S-transferase|nr:glutathione S-transferase [Burkholderiales bacterium]
MKLIGTSTSPYTRKARIVLAEKHLDCEFVVDSPYGSDSRVADYNPLGKIPVLVLDEEVFLFDSRVIVEYLDSASPVGRLIPEDVRHRIQVRRWEALADGCADAALAIVAERRRSDPQQRSAEWIARQEGKVKRALKTMSADLGAKSWCSGEQYNLSDIAAGCALGYLDLRLPEIDWRKDYPNLMKFADKLARRSSFKETMPAKD